MKNLLSGFAVKAGLLKKIVKEGYGHGVFPVGRQL